MRRPLVKLRSFHATTAAQRSPLPKATACCAPHNSSHRNRAESVEPELRARTPPRHHRLHLNAISEWYSRDPLLSVCRFYNIRVGEQGVDGKPLPDERARHAGCPVVRGEKMVATVWLHELALNETPGVVID